MRSPEAALAEIPRFSRDVSEERRFALALNHADDSEYSVISGGWERCTPGYVIERPGIPSYAIELLADGDGSLSIGGRSMAMPPGTVFSYGPGVAHRIQQGPGPGMSKYFINTTGPGAVRMLELAGIGPGSVMLLDEPDAVRGLFDLIIEWGCSGTRHASHVCDGLYRGLIAAIAGARVPFDAADMGGYVTYRRCRALITARHHELDNLQHAAAECGVSSEHLCRLFRAFGHETPYQLMTRLRLGRAASMLQSGMTAKDIAASLGFADQFHFSRCFKSVYGMPPSAYARLAGRDARPAGIASGAADHAAAPEDPP